MLKFGSNVTGFNLVNFLSRNADNILIGRFFGGHQLGLYDRAYRLLLFPITQLHGPIGQVMVPLLSRLQGDPNRYRLTYLKTVSLMMACSQPGIVFAIVFADDVFNILMGPVWAGASPIFQWLGVAALHQVMSSTTGWLYLSQGRGAELFSIGTAGSVVTVASFAAGLPWGAVGVAAAYSVVNYVVLVPLIWWAAGRRGPVSTKHLVGVALPHAVGIVACGALLFALKRANWGDLSVTGAAAMALLAYLSYIAAVLPFETSRSALRDALKIRFSE
jgi:PST family polysaccharide transporter